MQRHGVSACTPGGLHESGTPSKPLQRRIRCSSAVPIATAELGHSRASNGAFTPFPACQAPWQSTKQESQAGSRHPDSEESGELIFNLYNRGSGWGEEIIPHITVKKRAVVKKQCRSWQEGSIEALLAAEGVQEDAIDGIVTGLVAWRLTKAGRPLVDKRRKRRVCTNIPLVVDHLVNQCDVPRTATGVGALIQRYPMVLLCKPVRANDRFFRNACSLAAFAHSHGHCRIPGSSEWVTLRRFVDRSRALFAEGRLEQEKVDILANYQFDFGVEEEAVTKQWDSHFDALLEWLLCPVRDTAPDPSAWRLMEWAARGGLRERRLAAWVAQQRHLAGCKRLSAAALARLEAIEFELEFVEATGDDNAWLEELGALMHAASRARVASSTPTRRLQPPSTGVLADSQQLAARPSSYRPVPPRSNTTRASDNNVSRNSEESLDGRSSAAEASEGGYEGGWEEFEGGDLGPESLETLEDVGLPRKRWMWLQRQRVLWRSGRLQGERVQLLYAAGVEMDPYTTSQWRRLAHATSSHLLMHSVPFLTAATHPSALAGAATTAAAARHSEVRRWVLTQQRLMHEGRLTVAQTEYLTAAGLGWLLVRDAVAPRDHAWHAMLCSVGVSLGLAPQQVSHAADLLLGQAGSAHSVEPGKSSSLNGLQASNHGHRRGFWQRWGLSGSNAGDVLSSGSASQHSQHAQRAQHRESHRQDGLREALLATFSWHKGHSRDEQQVAVSTGHDIIHRTPPLKSPAASAPRTHVSYAYGYTALHSTADVVAPVSMHDDYSSSGFGLNNLGHNVNSQNPPLPPHRMGFSGAGSSYSGGQERSRWSTHTHPLATTPVVSQENPHMYGNLVEQAFASTRAAMHEEHATPDACAAASAASFCAALDYCRVSQDGQEGARDASMHGSGGYRRGLTASMRAWAAAQNLDNEGGFWGALLADWLEQQHALLVLGLLSQPRAAALMCTVSHVCASDTTMQGCYACSGSVSSSVSRLGHGHAMHESHARGYNFPQSSPDCTCPEESLYTMASGSRLRSQSGMLNALCTAHGVLVAQHSNRSASEETAAIYAIGRDAWGSGIAQLMRFRRRHGDVDVPLLGEHEELAAWLEDAKAQRGTLRPQQVAQLWGLGVPLHLRAPPRSSSSSVRIEHST